MSARGEKPRRTYRALLQRSPADFLKELGDNLLQGAARRQDSLLQLDLLAAHGLAHLLRDHRAHGGDSLLQLAAIFHGDPEVMARLAALCPPLLLLARGGDYEGQTVLHTLVSKQNLAAARALLAHRDLRQPWLLLNAKVSPLAPPSA